MYKILTLWKICKKWFSWKKNEIAEYHQKNFLHFKKKLGLDPQVVICDEQDIISVLHVAFEGEILFTQYYVENKRFDAYFPKYKVRIEVDDHDHDGRNSNYEKSRQFMIESHGITVIRTNSEAAYFGINRLIIQIYMHIIKSTKKSWIDDLSKRYLELEFRSNHSIKSKCLKWVVKKKTCQITKSEKHKIQNKANINWKRTCNNILFEM